MKEILISEKIGSCLSMASLPYNSSWKHEKHENMKNMKNMKTWKHEYMKTWKT